MILPSFETPRLRLPKCGSARSFAFTEGFGFRRDGMVMLPLLVTNGAGYRLIANEAFRFVTSHFLPATPDTATEAEAPRRYWVSILNDTGSRGV
jgi:hypothetical protein